MKRMTMETMTAEEAAQYMWIREHQLTKTLLTQWGELTEELRERIGCRKGRKYGAVR